MKDQKRSELKVAVSLYKKLNRLEKDYRATEKRLNNKVAKLSNRDFCLYHATTTLIDRK